MKIEEKARAYDEVVERLNEWFSTRPVTSQEQAFISEIFPELATSYDKQIKEEIADFLLDASNGIYRTIDKDIVKEWTNWIERQEQNHWKPTDEQLSALNEARDRNDIIGCVLNELYQDIYKLKYSLQ